NTRSRLVNSKARKKTRELSGFRTTAVRLILINPALSLWRLTPCQDSNQAAFTGGLTHLTHQHCHQEKYRLCEITKMLIGLRKAWARSIVREEPLAYSPNSLKDHERKR